MMRSLLDPLPCRKRALFLNESLKKKLQASLTHLLEVNQDNLGDYYSRAEKQVTRIKTSPKISSFFYALNALLLQGTTEDQIPALLPTIIAIIDLLEQSPLKGKNFRYFDFENNHSQEINDFLRKNIVFEELSTETNIWAPNRADSAAFRLLIQQTLEFIQHIDPESYDEMQIVISEFMNFTSGGAKGGIKGGTSFNLLGLVSLNVAHHLKRSVLNLAEVLTHEAAHLYLYSLCTEDPLVLNDYREKYFSPFRKSARPMIGVYHSAFVMSRVIRFLNVFKQSTLWHTSNLQEEAEQLLQQYEEIRHHNMENIHASAKLTDLGKALIESTEHLLTVPKTVAIAC